MHFERLTKHESDIIREVLLAAADGPFFPDWEFETLFGLTRAELRGVSANWPLPNLPPDLVVRAVNNSLNWLLSYPHRKHDLWADWVSVDQSKVNELYNAIRGTRSETPFDRMW